MVELSPTGGSPKKDPYEKLRLQEIGEQEFPNKRKREEEERKLSKKKIFIGILANILKKIADLIFPKTLEGSLEMRISVDSLEKIFAGLNRLKKENFSQDLDYLNTFSQNWHMLLQEMAKLKKSSLHYKKIEQFVQLLQSYPENSAHTLGYYLSEYAGSEWLPLPFMAMLDELHQNYQSNPDQSPLNKWSEELQNLIEEIKSEKHS